MKKREGNEYTYRENGMILSKKIYNNKNGKLSNMEIYDYLGSPIYSLHIEENNIYHEKVNHPLLKYTKINGKYNGMYEIYECQDKKLNINVETNELLINKILNTCDIQYENINLIKQCHYKDDILDGIYIEYQNGVIIKECKYINNKLEGEYKEFDKFNKPRIICNYKNNLLHGKYIKYDDYKSYTIYNYDLGLLNGECLYFFNNILIKKCYYINNLLNGKYIKYDSKCNIELIKNYNLGLLNGEFIIYYNNKIGIYDKNYNKIHNQIYIKCNYIDNEYDGEYIKYDENNNILIKCNYIYGRLDGEYIEKKNNQLIKHFHYNNGNLCLENIQYYENNKNKIFMIKIFNKDNILIESKLYSKSGALVYNRYIENNNIIENFNHPILCFTRINCIIIGKYKEYEYNYYSENYKYDYYDTIYHYELNNIDNTNLILTKYCIYDDDGQLDNIYKEYNNNGQLVLFCNYHHGKLYGEYKKYDKKGKLIHECNYYNDILHGKHYIYNSKNPDYIHIESEFLFGKLHNNYKKYCISTYKLQINCNYNNGLLHGKYIQYKNDIDILSCSYNNGVLHGEYVMKNNNNELLKHCYYYLNNYHGEYKKYSNGILIKERNYIHGVLNGKFKEYDTDGDLILDLYYKNDLPVKKPLTILTLNNKCSIDKICFINKLQNLLKYTFNIKNNKIDIV